MVGSLGVAACLLTLVFVAPAAARICAATYLLAAVLLWWGTGGEHPWIWSPGEKRGGDRISEWKRGGLCLLQINRSLARAAGNLAFMIFGLALGVAAITVVVAAFDFLADWTIHPAAYVGFFRHDLAHWFAQAADGHAGTPPVH